MDGFWDIYSPITKYLECPQWIPSKMTWTILAAVGILLGLWLFWRTKNRRLLAAARKFPGPPSLPVLGHALKFMVRPEGFISLVRDLTKEYGDVVGLWLGPHFNVLVSDPDDLKKLLTSPKTSYKGPQYKYMANILGGGILSGSGPVWRKHRKIANPNYGKRAIESYGPIFNHEADLLMDKLRKKTEQQFDIYTYIVQTTSYSVCRSLMGLTKEQTMNLPHLQDLIEDTPVFYDLTFDRMTKWYLQIEPIFLLSNYNREIKKFIAKISKFSGAILKLRNSHLKTLAEANKIDLMNSKDDSLENTQLSVIDRFILSGELNGEELLRETFTIFTSSQEASAKITSYVILMMAFHPECQDRLYAEIKAVIGDEDRAITNEDLKRMVYLEMVFKEVLRMFPIGAMLQRTVKEDVSISSTTIPAGSSLVVPIYHLHRDPRFWSNPDAFDPERFTPENIKRRNPHCYIPFSLGPMDCLGRYFGTKLIKIICVRVLREFKVVTTQSYEDLRLGIAISTIAMDGYPVTLIRRNQANFVNM